MEAEATQLWAWIGREIAEFGVRWSILGVALLGFSGWFGWRYREMKRRLSALEGARPPMPSINITNVVGTQKQRARFTGVFRLGTIHYPGLIEETDHPFLLVPEIFIETEGGGREQLNIEGLSVADEKAPAVQLMGGVRITTTPPLGYVVDDELPRRNPK